MFQVEDRLKFYETGDLPKKNLEVMQEALEEVQKEASEFKTVEGKKKKKKDKKVRNSVVSWWGKKKPEKGQSQSDTGYQSHAWVL